MEIVMKKLMLITSILTVQIHAMDGNHNSTIEKTLQYAYKHLVLYELHRTKIQNMIEVVPSWEAELNAIGAQIEQQAFPSEESMEKLCNFPDRFRNLQDNISLAKKMRFYEDDAKELADAADKIETLYDTILVTLYETMLAQQSDNEPQSRLTQNVKSIQEKNGTP